MDLPKPPATADTRASDAVPERILEKLQGEALVVVIDDTEQKRWAAAIALQALGAGRIDVLCVTHHHHLIIDDVHNFPAEHEFWLDELLYLLSRYVQSGKKLMLLLDYNLAKYNYLRMNGIRLAEHICRRLGLDKFSISSQVGALLWSVVPFDELQVNDLELARSLGVSIPDDKAPKGVELLKNAVEDMLLASTSGGSSTSDES